MPKQSRSARHQPAISNTYRFFVNPEALQGREVTLEDETAHQITTVLRLRPGEHVLLLDNSGWQYQVALRTLERGKVVGTVERKELAATEPRTKLTLYTAVMRPERFEWVLQKGTELGVSAFVPVICERSAVNDAGDLSERKTERWSRIIREAAEQSCRGKLPRLSPALHFPTACEQANIRGLALLLWEGGSVPSLRKTLRGSPLNIQERVGQSIHTAQPFSVAVFSGPEGGFTQSELETAQSRGIIPVTIGPRTLRAETAPLAAAAAIFYEMGDMD